MLVWYAAYGSNLLRARFLTYLRGGPVPGSGRTQHGARDPADPLDDRAYRLSRELLFAGRASGWGDGGVCFVEPATVDPDGCLGRAWLITDEQLADVWAQENGKTSGPAVDVEALAAGETGDFGSGWYRYLEPIGELDGHPVATFTFAPDEGGPPGNAADVSYLTIMGLGLAEAWQLGSVEAAEYLAGRRGNVGAVDVGALAEAIAGAGDAAG
ncbi:MAG: histone deacetylase [Actinomycetota bacterium]